MLFMVDTNPTAVETTLDLRRHPAIARRSEAHMGMFDELTCRYPLPIENAAERVFQTKDLECFMDHYEIRADGTLWHEDYDIEDRSDPTREGIEGLRGLMTRVNKRWELVEDFTGEVRFYNELPEGWCEFSAYFVRGALQHLTTIEMPRRAVAEAGTPEQHLATAASDVAQKEGSK